MILSSINNTYTHLTCPVIKTIVCANICNKIFYHSYNLNDGIYNTHTYIYIQTVLELDFRAVKFLFFPRRDLNPHHCCTAAPFA